MVADYQKILDHIAIKIPPYFAGGKIADYIPALAAAPRDCFGMAVTCVSGEESFVGEADRRFSVQSISKVFALTLALQAIGPRLWDRLGREPSGDPFNSLIQLEHEHGIPRNPFINAGALVVVDRLMDVCSDPKQAVLEFVREVSGCNDIEFDLEVARSEADWGYGNKALANFLKSFGNMDHDVDVILDAYFHHCSLAMSCREISRAFVHLANRGKSPLSGKLVTDAEHTKRINALMLTCGLYDSVGDFAYRVGIPGKSGVGGGIAAVIPGTLSTCVYSPGLDQSGNSLAGTKALEIFTTESAISIF
jgi:glutaminase